MDRSIHNAAVHVIMMESMPSGRHEERELLRRGSVGLRSALPIVLVLGATFACGKPALEGETSSAAKGLISERETLPRVENTAGHRDIDGLDEGVWKPPRYPPMEGLDGAMQRLAEGDLESSLRRVRKAGIDLGSTDKSDLGALSSTALAGLARAALMEKRPEAAVALLESLRGRGVPYEGDPVLLVELARAREMLADRQREAGDEASAAEHLRAALNAANVALKDPRNSDVAPHEMFVARLWSALAEVSDDVDERARALGVLGRVIDTYPRYPKRGALMLERARMLAQHGGSPAQIADAYRTVIIERGEEPVARRAEEALSSLLERSNPDAPPELLTVEQRLEQASNAHDRFQPAFALEILERYVLGRPDISEETRFDAYFVRARSRFRARDYAGCVEDMERARVRWSREDYWEQYERCLRYGGEHARASQLWADRARREKSSTKVNRARWKAVTRAVIGGDYELASTRLDELGEKARRGVDTDERAWLLAWVPYRRGLLAPAEEGFRIYLQRKSPNRRFAAEYFLAKAMLRRGEEGKRTEAIERLRSLERRGMESVESHGILGGFPAYYGFLARWLLVREGLEVSAPPRLLPVPDSNPHLNYPSARMAFAKRSEATRALLPGLDRSEWLLAAGYLEESTQAFRIEVNRYLNGRSLAKGRKIRVPRSEALARGLSWKDAWEYPKPRPTREMILRLRDNGFAQEVRADLEALAYLLNQPHWYAKLLPSGRYPHRARNYLRPFRSDVERAASGAELDPMIFWSLMYTESRFNPFVASQVGATGLMQIYPPALRRRMRARGVFDGFLDVDTLFNAQTNLEASVMWVEDFMRRFSGNLALICASYNGGPHNVARWVRAKHARGELSMDEFVEEIEFRETRNYVRRVISVYAVYHLLYDGQLPPVENDLSGLFTAGEFKIEEVPEKQSAGATATSPQPDPP